MLSSYECIDGHEPRPRLIVELQLVENTLKLIDQAKLLLNIPAVNVLRRYLRFSLMNNNFVLKKKFLTCTFRNFSHASKTSKPNLDTEEE